MTPENKDELDYKKGYLYLFDRLISLEKEIVSIQKRAEEIVIAQEDDTLPKGHIFPSLDMMPLPPF